MNIKTFLKSVSGFSFVEIMVAMGLLGAISVGVMRVMDNANKASKTIEVKDDIIQMERQIADVLNSQNNCEETLGEKTINSNIPIIYQVVNNQPLAKFSVSSGTSNKIHITSMRVKEVELNGGDGSTSRTCSLTSRQANASCPLDDWILSCSGCGSGCFKKTSYGCSNTSTTTKTEPGVTAGKLYTCCRE